MYDLYYSQALDRWIITVNGRDLAYCTDREAAETLIDAANNYLEQ